MMEVTQVSSYVILMVMVDIPVHEEFSDWKDPSPLLQVGRVAKEMNGEGRKKEKGEKKGKRAGRGKRKDTRREREEEEEWFCCCLPAPSLDPQSHQKRTTFTTFPFHEEELQDAV